MDHRMRRGLAPLLLLFIKYVTAFIPGADGPVSPAQGLEGGAATLACPSAPDQPADEMMLLVWYKDNAPIYSYDARIGSSWSNEFFNSSGRVSVDLHRQPTTITVSRLREDDEGLYHCRVDFLMTPTRNIGVNLSIVVVPSFPFFLDEMGNKVESKVGPYHEGDTLMLSCLVIGGRPPPRISWYSGGALVDASDGASEVPGVKENELYLPLTREHSGPLTCRASNTELIAPVEASVEIELYLSPQNVSIHWVSGTDSEETLRAGEPAVVGCRAGGSHPAPTLAWWLDHRHLTQHSNQTWLNGSQTALSYLQLTPSVGDHGATLSCIATNPAMEPERASRADVITLNVTYSPIVEVSKVGDGKMNEVVELDTLHLECEIKANPPVDKIEWYFNDSKIHAGGRWGDNTSAPSLVVEESGRELAGRYACAAGNSVGETRAHAVTISVLYKPECSRDGITLDQETLMCHIDSLPPPEAYFWHITPVGLETQQLTTGSALLPLSQIIGPLTEPLHVTCSAENGIATQEKACERVVSLKHLRPPQPQHCDLAFEDDEVQMRCIPVENATHYEVSVWRMSSSNTSLILAHRGAMGWGSGLALARGPGPWLVRGSLGQLRAGDEAGAAACNVYGCSTAVLLRPTDVLLYAASPPWWHFLLERDAFIAVGAVLLIAVFILSTYIAVAYSRRRCKPRPPMVQVLQLDDVAREYLQALEVKRLAASSVRSCSSGYSGGSLESEPPAVDRVAKPYYWDQPDVTHTLHRESAV
ncbi:unnamed protein product [Plutella xylostella]|uniref:(diamondback moth) hypothetical protein n=1 Tax=Plutella xylostella TaxID=51655 RepID=A0A8S4DUT1_PLUXY|nr:unnamed protein product [Plutella xylostella]